MPAFSTLFLLVLSAYFVVHVVSVDITIGFTEAERNGLLALKAGFRNPFLDQNWHTFNCFEWYGVTCTGNGVVGVTLESLGITGDIDPHALYNLTQLSVLSFKNNSISGQLMDFSNNLNLLHLDLSTNTFDGPISPSLVNLPLLESLQLQENRLTGPLPGLNQASLKQLNVSNNDLSGPIPTTKTLQSFGHDAYDHNHLCGPPSSVKCDSVATSSGGSNKSELGFVLICVNVIGLFVIFMVLMALYKKNKQLDEKIKEVETETETEKKGEDGMGSKVVVVRDDEQAKMEQGDLVFVEGEAEFELGDLMRASAESLGKGNFGNTYRARLEDGRDVLVKRLRDLKPLSRDEFVHQLKAIAGLKHPNLTPLLAYYYSKDEKLLVHTFVTNKNLFDRLHGGRGTNGRAPFRWSARLAVARGVARAMEYLHMNHGLQIQVPHGNLKSSNVLVDENNMVFLSDYGLTSIISNTITVQQMVAFKSPEYLTSKRISKKSDVWSYGTLVMELLTGRVGVHSGPRDDKAVDLCSWVHRAVREEWTAEIFDLEIMVQRGAINGMLKLLQLAVRCCDNTPEKRPEMGEVVREVESIKFSNVDSESEEDLSVDRSLTDDSMSATPSR